MLLSVVGVLAVPIALAGAFGGLRAQPSSPARATVGSTVDQGLFNVQILDARAGRIKRHTFDPATNMLIVRMRVTDLGDRTFGMSSFLGGIAAESKPGTYVAADSMRSDGDIEGNATSSIHPRLPLVVQVVWPLPDNAAPRTVTIALRKWEYGQSFTTDTFYWSVTKQSPITTKVAVPVHTGVTS